MRMSVTHSNERASRHRGQALRTGLAVLTGALLLAATASPALAAPHGGFGGGGHAAFGGGFGRGGSIGHAYGHPYGYGGPRYGGYGWRGYGWRGYGWGPYWGWGVGLGLGLYLSTLPWDYATYWWNGVPYYYAGNSYYVWDGTDGQYEVVQPPPQVSQQAATAPPMKLYAYPKNGQSAQQQAADTAECVRWAHQQVDTAATSGVPNHSAPPSGARGTPPGTLSTAPPAADSTAVGAIAAATAAGASPPGAGATGTGAIGENVGPGSQFSRAEAACLTGKGYSVD